MTISEQVQYILKEWHALLESQNSAPDWPYPGQSYASSNSAELERDRFWDDIAEFMDETAVSTAWRERNK